MAESAKHFPGSKIEALALTYVQSQDLTGKEPEDLAMMYDEAYGRIYTKFRSMLAEKKSNQRDKPLDY